MLSARVDGKCMLLSAWVDNAWCFRAGVNGKCVIGGKCMVLPLWVDSAWNYRRGWTVSGTCIMISVTVSINGLLVQEGIMISRSALI